VLKNKTKPKKTQPWKKKKTNAMEHVDCWREEEEADTRQRG